MPGREIERRDKDEPFPAQPERFPAGHQRTDPRAVGEKIGEIRRGRQEVLEIVQQQEHPPRAEPLVDALPDGALAQVAEPERPSHGGHDVVGLRQRGEMVGQPGGSGGIDHAFAQQHGRGIGVEIMGAG